VIQPESGEAKKAIALAMSSGSPMRPIIAFAPSYACHRSVMDSSLDVTIAKKQIGPDVEAAISDT
jgi:hypothetical protein